MPSNPFADELARRSAGNPFAAELERRSAEPSAAAVGRETFSRGVANNLLAIPSASGDMLALASAAAQQFNKTTPIGMLVNKWRGTESPSFSETYDAEKKKFPASALRAIPRPTTNDVTAAARSIPSLMPGGETPREAYDRNLTDVEAEEFAMRDTHPTAAKVGDVGADIASLFLARRGTGMGKLIQSAETKLGVRSGAKSAETLAEDLNKVFTAGPLKTLARGAGRAVETGIEATALDIVKDPDADPVEIAAVAAGGQMVGSGFLAGGQALTSGGMGKAGLNITVAAMTAWGLLQVLKSATPGGEDRILESMESGYDKVAFALAAGAGSAVLGATRYGRGNTALSEQTRTFLDGVATAHRGTTLSLLTSWNDADESGREAIEKVLTETAKDPHYRGANAAERRVVSQLRNRYRTSGSF